MDRIFQVTQSDAVKFLPKRDNPNVIWTGFDKDDHAGPAELTTLEAALHDVQDHAVVACPNRKGLKAQHKFKALPFARTRKGIQIQIFPNNTQTTLIITGDGVIVPPFAAFNELVTVGRFETAVRRTVELMLE